MMQTTFYVERRPNGQYAVYAGETTTRARAVLATQRLAVLRAKELDPAATVLVERVRYNEKAGQTSWRRV